MLGKKKHVAARNALGVALMLAFTATPVVFAAAAEKPSKLSADVGLAVSNITYKEPGVMREDGHLYGITGSLVYPVRDYQFRADVTWMTGSVDYMGSGTIKDVTDRLFEIRGTVGRVFELTGWRSTPYMGLGYRYLFDGLGGKISSTGAAGYDRESRYYYVPIGAEFARQASIFSSDWRFAATVEYDYFWKGQQYSKLGSIAGYEDIRNDQENGNGYRFSLRFSRALSGGNTFSIEPYMKYWHIEDSKITTDSAGRRWTEPNNTSREWGVRFAMGL